MTPEIAAVLRRCRKAASFYVFAWVASPATLIAVILASLVFDAWRLPSREDAFGFTALLMFLAFFLVVIARPVFTYALWDVAVRTGQATFHPVVLALTTLVVPWLPGVAAVRRATTGLRAVDGRADVEPSRWALLFAGPLMTIPGLVLFAISGTLDEAEPGRDPPWSIYVLALLLAVYAGTRALVALRVRGHIDDILMRPVVDDLRASHSAPVGGG